MAATVYTTAGGRRFHTEYACRALRNGQALNDWEYDYEFPPPAGACLPQQYAIEAQQPLNAARAGYTACRVCVPRALALAATGETYGHEPVQMMRDGWDYAPPICVRCNERRRDGWGRWVYRPAPWPCTSAVVLGLVPRCPDCGWGIDIPGGGKCRSCEHSDQLDALGAAL